METSLAFKIAFSTIYLVIMCIFAIYGLHRYFLLYLYYHNGHRKPKPKRRFEELPRVTVQLPMYNEKYVVERLLDAVCALDYPRDRLEIQVLDDSTDETTAIAARKVEEARAAG